jgi:hypothetical protein
LEEVEHDAAYRLFLISQAVQGVAGNRNVGNIEHRRGKNITQVLPCEVAGAVFPDLALQKQVEMDVGQLQRGMPPPSAPPAHAEVSHLDVAFKFLSYCLLFVVDTG